MIFNIFKKTGEIYFDHNGIDDYDGDDGYYYDIDVPYEDVKKDLVSIIADHCHSKGLNIEREQFRHVLSKIIDDYDLWDYFIETHHDDLQNLYEESENG